MSRLQQNANASLEFILSWQDSEAVHTSRYFGARANLWRDALPEAVREGIVGLAEGEVRSFRFAAGEVVPGYDTRKVVTCTRRPLENPFRPGEKVEPRLGRFYPEGFFCGLVDCFPQSLTPVRVIDINTNRMTIDRNHALAAYPLDMTVKVAGIERGRVERGGRCTDWCEEISLNGPGLQSRWQGRGTDFGGETGLQRLDRGEDTEFYREPRLVGHIDSFADRVLTEAYGRLLPNGARVLDLMSSLQSHLPAGRQQEVTGLGLNMVEMEANEALFSRLVQDLNIHPELPFPPATFEAVVCSLSVEYLTRPMEVIREATRVLAPGGVLAVSFSNRWFPAKVVDIWLRLHEFERVGLILDYLLETAQFENLQSEAVRNYPRPEDDPHYGELFISDPVYVISGRKIQVPTPH